MNFKSFRVYSPMILLSPAQCVPVLIIVLRGLYAIFLYSLSIFYYMVSIKYGIRKTVEIEIDFHFFCGYFTIWVLRTVWATLRPTGYMLSVVEV